MGLGEGDSFLECGSGVNLRLDLRYAGLSKGLGSHHNNVVIFGYKKIEGKNLHYYPVTAFPA